MAGHKITAEMLASADRMHATGKEGFHSLVSDLRRHRDSCPECELHGEEVSVARISAEVAGLIEALLMNTPSLAVSAMRGVCQIAAYAVVRAEADRPVAPDLANYLARREGGSDRGF